MSEPVQRTADLLGLQVSLQAREGLWCGDPAVDWGATSPEARKAYFDTGEARHLVLYAGREPLRFAWRALSTEERAIVDSLCSRAVERPNAETGEPEPTIEARWAQRLVWAFRAGVDLPDLPIRDLQIAGKPVPRRRERIEGLDCLAEPLLEAVAVAFGDACIRLFGTFVWRASRMSPEDFFPSSPASTGKSAPTDGASASSASCASAATSPSSAPGSAPTSG